MKLCRDTKEEVELTYRDSTCCTAVMESLKVTGVSERRSVDALMRLRYDEACEFGTAEGNSAAETDAEDDAEDGVVWATVCRMRMKRSPVINNTGLR